MSVESAPEGNVPDRAESGLGQPPPRPGLRGLVLALLARYLRFSARHRLVGCVGALVLVFGLCGLVLRFTPGLERDPAALSDLGQMPVNEIGTTVEPAEPGVEQYLAGMAAYDARKMWDAYAEAARQELAAQGRSTADLQRELDEARAGGAKIGATTHIGTYLLRDGRRYVFYIVERSGLSPDGARDDIYFIFTVDPSGKILSVT